MDWQSIYQKYETHLQLRDAKWPAQPLGIAKRFVDWCVLYHPSVVVGGESDGVPYGEHGDALGLDSASLKSLLLAYFGLLKSQGYTSQTRKRVAGVIRTMLRCSAILWPLPAGEGPRDEGDIYSPSLDPRAIKQMVEAALNGKLTDCEASILALATTYGLRRQEISNLTSEHLMPWDKDGGAEAEVGSEGIEWTLHIPSAKGNLARQHLVPAEVASWVIAWGFAQPITLFGMWQVFRNIEEKAGLTHAEEVGWHAIRRSLDTLLLERLPESIIESYMGWTSSLSRMPKRYHKTSFVGYGEEGREYTPRWRWEIDLAVFEVHPFLPYWAEDA